MVSIFSNIFTLSERPYINKVLSKDKWTAKFINWTRKRLSVREIQLGTFWLHWKKHKSFKAVNVCPGLFKFRKNNVALIDILTFACVVLLSNVAFCFLQEKKLKSNPSFVGNLFIYPLYEEDFNLYNLCFKVASNISILLFFSTRFLPHWSTTMQGWECLSKFWSYP